MASPSRASHEYWHIGDTTNPFGNLSPRPRPRPDLAAPLDRLIETAVAWLTRDAPA